MNFHSFLVAAADHQFFTAGPTPSADDDAAERRIG
jgi:hypothetical protein